MVGLPDGRRIRYVTGGADGPLVVFECGLGNTAGTWVAVQHRLSATCRTIAYDRAGLGGSDRDIRPRSLDRMADDLAEFLDALDLDEPVVLVAHSWGGPLVRLFAERRPERVRGLMLVDPTITVVRKWLRIVKSLYLKYIWTVRLGGRDRLLRTYRTGRWAQEMSPRDLEVALLDFMTAANLRTSWQEIREQCRSWPALGRLESTPSQVPIRFVVGRDRPEPLRSVMAEGCARIAALSPIGDTVLIENAGHSIPQERPIRTANEIERFVRELPAG
jgi:pimeloyl-ACP methyl ester carboxylesterase